MGFLLSACGNSNELNKAKQNIDKKDIEKIIKKSPHISNLEANYGIVFTNATDGYSFAGFNFGSDFYIREDLVRIGYGFDLNKVKIKITQDGEDNVLNISLPEPKQISEDKTILKITTAKKNSTPIAPDGQRLDVEKEVNREIEEVKASTQAQTFEKTKEASNQYFQALADSFGMKLNLEWNKN